MSLDLEVVPGGPPLQINISAVSANEASPLLSGVPAEEIRPGLWWGLCKRYLGPPDEGSKLCVVFVYGRRPFLKLDVLFADQMSKTCAHNVRLVERIERPAWSLQFRRVEPKTSFDPETAPPAQASAAAELPASPGVQDPLEKAA